jgi:asparagine synthase (glutamine-hydrolysing)
MGCGIFGRIEAGGRPVEPRLLLRQVNTMVHRGPDAYGLLLADRRTGRTVSAYNHPPAETDGRFDAALGHRRLSILDLSDAAAQPMADSAGRLWVAFNGEIYNFEELRRELVSRGHVFRTDHSDTEVLLYAFKEWGEGCLNRLRGMFAFGILDLASRRLFLARDRLGKKPLYYRVAPEGFQFASELKAIIADPGVPRRIDPVALAQYLTYGYIPAPHTIYQGIWKLPPAHCAWVYLDAPDRVVVKEYWALRYEPDDGRRLEDWMEEFDAEFATAVRLRMVSDVPLGALLSGGIDSTLVVRAMSRLTERPIKTFSIGFEEEEYSELKWAREVAGRYGTEHYEEIVRPDALALLPKLAAQYDEPFGDSSAVPTFCVFQMARQHVTVALSGDGGDELFVGYNRYQLFERRSRFDWVPFPLRRVVFGPAARLWPEHTSGKQLLTDLSNDPYGRYLDRMGKPRALRFLAPDLRHAVLRLADPQAFVAQAWRQAPQEPISRLQYVDTKTYLPGDILVKVDRASMLNSLEARCPLLDHKVVELAARVPIQFKYSDGVRKLLLKQILLPDLGETFLSRRKKGFSVPLNRWFHGELAGYVRERLLSANGNLPEEVDRREVERLVVSYREIKRDLSFHLWNLLMLSAWTEVYGATGNA